MSAHHRRRPPRAIEFITPLPLRLGGGSSAPSVGIGAHGTDDFNAQYLGPLARGSAPKTAPVKLHALATLARTTFSREKIEWLIGMTNGEQPNDVTAMQRYRLKILHSSFQWRVRQLPINRFQPRIVRAAGSIHAEDSTTTGSTCPDGHDGSRNGNDGGSNDGGSDDGGSNDGRSNAGSDDGSGNAGSDSSRRNRVESDASGVASHQAVGHAADVSSDADMEDVLFVRAASRSADEFDAQGQRMGAQTWYEVVPTERIGDVLQSLWHIGGIQSLSAAKTYARTRELYVGISIEAVASFIRRQEAAQLAKSNLVADKMLAPRLPHAVNELWYSDITFLSSDIPASAPSGGARYIGFLSILDSLSRFAWTVPVRDKSAATIAAAHEGVILAFGAPRLLVQDNAQENSGYTMGALAQRHNITLRFTKPHVSQENGAERVHQTLKNLLRTAALELQPSGSASKQLALPPLLARITLQYNSTVNATTKLTPFTVFFGRPPPPSGPPQLVDNDGGSDEGDADAARNENGVDGDGDDNDDDARERRLAHRPIVRKELKDLAATGVPRPPPGRRQGRVAPMGAPQNLADDYVLDDGHAQAAAAAATAAARAAAASESGAVQMARARQRLEGLVVNAATIATLAPPRTTASASTTAAQSVSRISALVWDRRFHRILYLTTYGAKAAAQRQEFAPASDFRVNDEQLQQRIVKMKWTVAFIGGVDGPGYMGAADREEDDVIIVPDVVDEVERGDVYNDGQDPRGKDIDDGDGAQAEVVEPAVAGAAAGSAAHPRPDTATAGRAAADAAAATAVSDDGRRAKRRRQA